MMDELVNDMHEPLQPSLLLAAKAGTGFGFTRTD
jgi:hypothetical protein